jgi:aryl-alcohol dehydrogenase-like predicted oxidoreductase
MNRLSRIGLGTAQFGSHYGISNRHGRPSERDIADILGRVIEAGVDLLDTATAYGDAESIIGRHLPVNHQIRIVTKVPPVRSESIEVRDGRQGLDAIADSLERLRVDSVHGVLIHQAPDLAKTGWQHLVEALQEMKARGWTAHVGASVYDADQLALVESRLRPDLVQLPLNALDRRPIASGMLARLKAAGTEIHARSVFLQGLLLMIPDELPKFFDSVRQEIVDLHRRWQEQGLNALAGCLAFALQQPEIDAVIVGINRRSELDEIIAAATAPAAVDIGPAPNVDQIYLDPSRWPVSAL